MAKPRAKRAKVFWTGRSQAVRLPKEFRFATDTVLVRRQGSALVLEAADDWPEGYVESFAGAPEDFVRPTQGNAGEREKLE
jgi:antitoxin VapB